MIAAASLILCANIVIELNTKVPCFAHGVNRYSNKATVSIRNRKFR
jgi:hypothetical protein